MPILQVEQGVHLATVPATLEALRAVGADGLDERQALMEALYCFRRAGADLILTYYAKQAASWLADKS